MRAYLWGCECSLYERLFHYFYDSECGDRLLIRHYSLTILHYTRTHNTIHFIIFFSPSYRLISREDKILYIHTYIYILLCYITNLSNNNNNNDNDIDNVSKIHILFASFSYSRMWYQVDFGVCVCVCVCVFNLYI